MNNRTRNLAAQMDLSNPWPQFQNASLSESPLIDWLSANFSRSHNDLPSVCWQVEGGSFMHLEFMVHDSGCWAILSKRHSGEETGRINIGTYKKPAEIEALIAVLKIGR